MPRLMAPGVANKPKPRPRYEPTGEGIERVPEIVKGWRDAAASDDAELREQARLYLEAIRDFLRNCAMPIKDWRFLYRSRVVRELIEGKAISI